MVKSHEIGRVFQVGEQTKDKKDLGDQPRTSETVNSINSNESAGAPAGLLRGWDISLYKFAV